MKILSIERNQIKVLPISLGDMPELQRFTIARNPIKFPPPEVCDYDPNRQEMHTWLSQIKEYMRNKANPYDGYESGLVTRLFLVLPKLMTVTKKSSQPQLILEKRLAERTAWIQIRLPLGCMDFRCPRVPSPLTLQSLPPHLFNLSFLFRLPLSPPRICIGPMDCTGHSAQFIIPA